jgi:TFIIF-interacting CTD phosphatase-like protein
MRPLLILDLDETLVWATEEEPRGGCDFRVLQYHVTRRPHLATFLDSVIEWFDVGVWTSSSDGYARAVTAEVFGEVSRLKYMWSASRCTQRFDEKTHAVHSIKDLKKVRRLGYPLERVLMIDDSPEKLSRHYGNHLGLRPFEGDPQDRELLAVLPYLEWIRSQEDMRRIEKRSWRNWRSA